MYSSDVPLSAFAVRHLVREKALALCNLSISSATMCAAGYDSDRLSLPDWQCRTLSSAVHNSSDQFTKKGLSHINGLCHSILRRADTLQSFYKDGSMNARKLSHNNTLATHSFPGTSVNKCNTDQFHSQ